MKKTIRSVAVLILAVLALPSCVPLEARPGDAWENYERNRFRYQPPAAPYCPPHGGKGGSR